VKQGEGGSLRAGVEKTKPPVTRGLFTDGAVSGGTRKAALWKR
jgi:hypothetical protein